MTNTNYTPGPWFLKSWHEPTIVTRDGDLIASVYADKNRKLIAAAPDLLAALQEIVRYHEDGEYAQHLDEQAERATAGNCTALDGLLSLAEVAIAKATKS